jgi:hypothetical protein
MSFEGLLTQTAVIHHVSNTGALDDRNHPTASETTTTAKTFLEYLSAEEDTFLRDTGRSSVRAYFLPSVVIDHTDRIEVNGEMFEVLGPPQPEVNARLGVVHHLEVYLTRAV